IRVDHLVVIWIGLICSASLAGKGSKAIPSLRAADPPQSLFLTRVCAAATLPGAPLAFYCGFRRLPALIWQARAVESPVKDEISLPYSLERAKHECYCYQTQTEIRRQSSFATVGRPRGRRA